MNGQLDAREQDLLSPLDKWMTDRSSSGQSGNGRCVAFASRRRLLFGILALVLIFVGCGRETKPQQRVVDLYIESDGDFLAYRPDTLTCPTGALVRLTFHHTGRFISARHDWVLVYPSQLESLAKDALANDGIISSKDDPRIIAATPMCDKGGTAMVQFVAPKPGDYPFLCSTHADDMRGILHVTK